MPLLTTILCSWCPLLFVSALISLPQCCLDSSNIKTTIQESINDAQPKKILGGERNNVIFIHLYIYHVFRTSALEQ